MAVIRGVLACKRSSTRPTSRSRCRTGVRGDSSGRSSQTASSVAAGSVCPGEAGTGSVLPCRVGGWTALACASPLALRSGSSPVPGSCPVRSVRRSAEGPGPVRARRMRALTFPGSWPMRRNASVLDPLMRRMARRRCSDDVWRAPTLWAMPWASHSSPARSRFVSQCTLGATVSIFAAPMPRSPNSRAAAPPTRRRPSKTSSEAAVRPSALAKARASARAPV